MARIYVRLKYFVAAYVRKTYGDGDDLAQEIVINPYSKAAGHLSRMMCNSSSKIVGNCFCERQWQRMMRGECIQPDADQFMVQPRDTREWLTEREVCQLSGIEPMRGEEMGEYICVSAPDMIMRKGEPVRTNGQWQLMQDAANDFIEGLEYDFDRAMFDFIDESLTNARTKGQKRYMRDAMEGFMATFDIRNCFDDREKRCLQRRYYRYMREKLQQDENVDYHTGKELTKHSLDAANRGKRIRCADDGLEYDSIHSAASAYGLGYQALWNSVRRGYRCGGKMFVLV